MVCFYLIIINFLGRRPVMEILESLSSDIDDDDDDAEDDAW